MYERSGLSEGSSVVCSTDSVPVITPSLMVRQSKTRAYQRGLCSPRFNGILMNINSKKLVNWNLFCQLMMIRGVNFLYNKMVSMENLILFNIGTVSYYFYFIRFSTTRKVMSGDRTPVFGGRPSYM